GGTAAAQPRPRLGRGAMGGRRHHALDRLGLSARVLAASFGRGRMKVLYFAWLRERLNRSSDEVAPPPDVVTLADLVAWLRARDEALDLAMDDPTIFKLSRDARI